MIGSRHLGSAPGRLALEIYLIFLGRSSSGYVLRVAVSLEQIGPLYVKIALLETPVS